MAREYASLRLGPNPDRQLEREIHPSVARCGRPNGKRILYFRNDGQGGLSSESCDLRGEQIALFSSQPTDVCVPHWTTDGRVFQLLDKKELEGSGTTVNLWETKVDAATGKPLGEARRLTQWSGGFSYSTAGYLSMTADGKQAVVLRLNAQSDIYVAELEAGGKNHEDASTPDMGRHR